MSNEKYVSAAREVARTLAEQVGWLVSPASGAAVLGVAPDTFEAYLHGNASLTVQWSGQNAVPCHLADLAEALADYAWLGRWRGDATAIEEAIAEFAVCADVIGSSPTGPTGADLLQADARTLLTDLLAAAQARHALDDPRGTLSIDQLAALARVSEKTVRMAAGKSNEHPLVTSKDGHRTYVTSADALAWLSRRPGFSPTRLMVDQGGQRLIVDTASLGKECRRARLEAGLQSDQLAKALKWDGAAAAAYERIEAGAPGDCLAQFPPPALLALAREIKLPDPSTFVRQAYRVLAMAHADALAPAPAVTL